MIKAKITNIDAITMSLGLIKGQQITKDDYIKTNRKTDEYLYRITFKCQEPQGYKENRYFRSKYKPKEIAEILKYYEDIETILFSEGEYDSKKLKVHVIIRSLWQRGDWRRCL